MDWPKLLGAIGMPLLLLVIGFRGIPKEKRKGALKVVLIIWTVVVVGTAAYLVVMITQSPRWVAEECDSAYAVLAKSDQAGKPSLGKDAFLAGCNRLGMSQAQCTNLDLAHRFSDSCSRYVDEIHAQLPDLDVGVQQRK